VDDAACRRPHVDRTSYFFCALKGFVPHGGSRFVLLAERN
jgi:hypothetical protein